MLCELMSLVKATGSSLATVVARARFKLKEGVHPDDELLVEAHRLAYQNARPKSSTRDIKCYRISIQPPEVEAPARQEPDAEQYANKTAASWRDLLLRLLKCRCTYGREMADLILRGDTPVIDKRLFSGKEGKARDEVFERRDGKFVVQVSPSKAFLPPAAEQLKAAILNCSDWDACLPGPRTPSPKGTDSSQSPEQANRSPRGGRTLPSPAPAAEPQRATRARGPLHALYDDPKLDPDDDDDVDKERPSPSIAGRVGPAVTHPVQSLARAPKRGRQGADSADAAEPCSDAGRACSKRLCQPPPGSDEAAVAPSDVGGTKSDSSASRSGENVDQYFTNSLSGYSLVLS